MLALRKLLRAGPAGGISSSAVEVEVRVGQLIIKNERRWKETMSQHVEPRVIAPTAEQKQAQEVEFKSGIDEIFAEHLKSILASKGFVGTVEPEQRLRLDKNGNRWLVNAAGVTMGKSESKFNIYRSDLALLSHEYDVRVDGARETAASARVQSAEEEKKMTENWVQERLKRRVCYRSKQGSGGSEPAFQWKLDLTEVEVTLRRSASGAAATSTEIELEMELEPAALQIWLEGDDENNEKTTRIASSLFALISLCIPSHLSAPKEAEMEIVTDECKQEIMRITELIKSRSETPSVHPSKGIEFVGCKPVNLLHKNLSSIRRKEYFVTEKSDGTRYLLYVVEDIQTRQPVAVLLDQSKVVHRMRGAHHIGSALGVGTVLDGELVFNRTFKQTMFLVFDVLMVGDRAELHKPFSHRVAVVETDVMQRINTHMGRLQLAADDKDKPTMVIRKVFYKKRDLSQLIGKMTFEDGERVFTDGPRRHHKSDGIIFQPASTAYKFSSDLDLLKWKWPELQSVDLQAVPLKKDGELVVSLMAVGPDRVSIDCTRRVNTTVSLGRFDTYRLLADISEDGYLSSSSANIAEFAYDVNIGAWRYMRPRKDKDKPNHIDTVLGVFAEMAEAISVEELEYTLLQPPGAQNDYNAQLTKMKRKLLDWQHQQQQQASK